MQTVAVGDGDTGGFADRGCGERRFLEFGRPYPLAGDLHQLVAAALMYVIALRVAHEDVARAEPSVAKLRRRFVRRIGARAPGDAPTAHRPPAAPRHWETACRCANRPMFPAASSCRHRTFPTCRKDSAVRRPWRHAIASRAPATIARRPRRNSGPRAMRRAARPVRQSAGGTSSVR